MLGGMQAALDQTVAYSAQRQQFGRAISSFQVIQHRLARMFVEIERMRGGLFEALSQADAPAAQRGRAMSGLMVLLSEAGRYVTENAIQVHGGVGVVKDFAVGHYHKRVVALEAMFGTAEHHLARYVILEA